MVDRQMSTLSIGSQAVVRWLSGSCPVVIRRSLEGCQAVIRELLSSGRLTFIGLSPGIQQAVFLLLICTLHV